VFIIHT